MAIAIGGLAVSALTVPEARCFVRLPSESCPVTSTSKAEDLYQKGYQSRIDNKHTEALYSFDQSIELDRNQAKVWNQRGLTLENLGRNQEALASYDEALSLDSTYELARQNRDTLQQELKKN
ncbi:MAG: tetratricopeptide repeat protein [Symplocastrum torsivum CPER-KK1]|uniref:Tetratricopeptide repeat protein n=1 Tax=Symplocastrum torsivum CPER-KK1 TaxID=450513 RepID=A0A951PHP1_9CYAN|nr:tetratricopeptide repeat protein [Symplocastrum torsivum CPER-KK1]